MRYKNLQVTGTSNANHKVSNWVKFRRIQRNVNINNVHMTLIISNKIHNLKLRMKSVYKLYSAVQTHAAYENSRIVAQFLTSYLLQWFWIYLRYFTMFENYDKCQNFQNHFLQSHKDFLRLKKSFHQ